MEWGVYFLAVVWVIRTPGVPPVGKSVFVGGVDPGPDVVIVERCFRCYSFALVYFLLVLCVGGRWGRLGYSTFGARRS